MSHFVSFASLTPEEQEEWARYIDRKVAALFGVPPYYPQEGTMVTTKQIRCDAEDCEEQGEFRITHEMLDVYPMRSDRVVTIDLCGPHAERFAISGRGGVKADFMVRVQNMPVRS